MKTINFELSKRLNDLWLLDNIETEYIYRESINPELYICSTVFITDWILYDTDMSYNDYKTLTLEEAIEFLKQFWELKIILTNYRCNIYLIWNKLIKWENIHISTDTNLEAIEKMLEYLLNNNLLTK